MSPWWAKRANRDRTNIASAGAIRSAEAAGFAFALARKSANTIAPSSTGASYGLARFAYHAGLFGSIPAKCAFAPVDAAVASPAFSDDRLELGERAVRMDLRHLRRKLHKVSFLQLQSLPAKAWAKTCGPSAAMCSLSESAPQLAQERGACLRAKRPWAGLLLIGWHPSGGSSFRNGAAGCQCPTTCGRG